MYIQKGDTLLFIGDSITDCGRKRPVGEGLHGALGEGYVALFHAMLEIHHPEQRCRVINMGCSGETSREVLSRWQTDVLALEPDVVVVMVGINDVWHAFNRPHQPQMHVQEAEFGQNLRTMAENSRGHVRKLVFASPYFIEPNRQEPMRRKMDCFGQRMREEAQRAGALFIDTQAAFDRLVPAWYHPSALAWDRVHPTQSGHLLLAETLARALCGDSWQEN